MSEQDQNNSKSPWAYAGLGASIPVSITFWVLLGIFADHYFKTSFVFTLIGCFIGIASAVALLIKISMNK
jgi:F0F1-type ATP synthase assembly protein I